MEEMTFPSVLPPGFRFHPTDEELIVYYLENQASSNPCPASIIPELDIYKFDPWQLPTEMMGFGGNERYFFTPREKKYPNGSRPNRATLSGYWKATGTDKAIYSGARFVGIKKALVFYKGRPPKGTKTDWIMHEYKLNDPPRAHRQMISTPGSMKLDDWVLCRIYKRRRVGRLLEQKEEEEEDDHQLHQTPPIDAISAAVKNEHIGGDRNQQPPSTFPFSHPAEPDYFGPISHLLNVDAGDGSYISYDDLGNLGFDPDRNGFGSIASDPEFRVQ